MIERLRAQLRATAGDGATRQLAGGAIIALVIKTASAGLAFVMFVVLARAMAPEEYGRFASWFSLALFLAIGATLGQPKLILRFLGSYRKADSAPDAREVSRFSLRRLAGTSVLVTLGCAVVAGVLYSGRSVDGAGLWIGLALLVTPYALSDYYSHGLRALGRVSAALVPRDIVWRGAIVAMAAAAIVSGARPRAGEVLIVCAVVLAAAVAAQWWIFRREMNRTAAPRDSVRGPASADALRQWKRATPGLALLCLMSEAFPHAFVVVTGLSLSTADVGPFFSAMKTALLLSLPLEATNMITAPLLARYHHEKRRSDLQATCRTAIALSAPVTLAGMLVLVFFGRPILALFGPSFGVAYPALLIMAAARMINALCGPTGFLMMMTGHERRYLLFLGVANFAGITALVVLAPVFGLAGAATGVLVSQCGWNIAVWLWARRHLRVDPTVLALWPRLLPSPPDDPR